jgi:hypothetical protein
VIVRIIVHNVRHNKMFHSLQLYVNVNKAISGILLSVKNAHISARVVIPLVQVVSLVLMSIEISVKTVNQRMVIMMME